MKSICLFVSLSLILTACKKDINEIQSTNAQDVDQLITAFPNDAVLPPAIDVSKSTPTQYAYTASFNSFTQKFTLDFAAKKSGIKITSLTFVAYGLNSKDAATIRFADSFYKAANFSPATNFPKAKAAAKISGLSIKIHSGGVLTPITFNIIYGQTTTNTGAQAGDTVSVRLASVQYTDLQRPDTVTEIVYSSYAPVMMLTNGTPGIFVFPADTTKIHAGLTKIIELALSGANKIAMNNLPLRIDASNVTISNNLVLKDYYGNTMTTSTVVSGKNYTINLQPNLVFSDPDGYNYTVYANVLKVKSNAVIQTSFQPSSNFSWTDVDSYNKKIFTTDNTKYLQGYPTNIIVTRN